MATNSFVQVRQVVDNILQDDGTKDGINKKVTAMFKYLEEKTGVDRKFLWWGLVVFVILWLMMGYAGQLVSNFIGILYPAYASIYAIESTDTNDDTKWLTYWIVYSIFSFIECFISYIVGWFPLYWLTKCTFLVWLMIPTDFNGSLVLYNSIIKPYFLQYHNIIDSAVNEIEHSAADFIEKNK